MYTIARPIPISNTQPSKHLRIAAAEVIIAKEVCEGILQPLYSPPSPARNKIANVLNRLLNKDPRQEAILPSLLLAAHAIDERI